MTRLQRSTDLNLTATETNMHFQFDVSGVAKVTETASGTGPPLGETTDLLQQLLEVQREHLHLQRQAAASQDSGGRWRAVLARWQDDFGTLPVACRRVLPHLERAYIGLIAELTEHLVQLGDEPLDNEFALAEFLDRYGIRLGQLGGVLSVVGPLADLAPAENAPSN